MIFPDDNLNPLPPTESAPTPPPEAQPPRGPMRPLLAAAVLTVVVAAFGGAALSHVLWPSNNSSTGGSLFGGSFQGSPQNGSGGSGGSNLFGNNGGSGGGSSASSAQAASVGKKVDPGLVDINTNTQAGPAAGTGMVVTPQGEVITNNHVISGATSISVTDIGNGRTYPATVVGYDRKHDVAVIMIQGASGLQTVPLGDSSTVKVGADVVTLGNAGGVGGTPSAAGGSVDALNQSIKANDPEVAGDSESLRGLIEINGDIQPGDSGGPLVSGSKVVGMDTAASVGFDFQSTSGAGFAIPIDQVVSISRQILAGQSTSSVHIGKTAIMGVEVASNNATNDLEVNCPTSLANSAGVLIAGVPNDLGTSPAQAAGVQACDLLTKLNGTAVASPTALLNLMETHHPGEQVTLTWLDPSGASHHAAIKLVTGPPD
jgi:S1-C subfamily serine protease